MAARVLRAWSRDGKLSTLPFGAGAGWTAERDMPAPAGRTFRELYRQRKSRQNQNRTEAAQ